MIGMFADCWGVVGKLLSMNLKDEGVAVAMVHPGFMRTEMTKGVGFDKVRLPICLPDGH